MVGGCINPTTGTGDPGITPNCDTGSGGYDDGATTATVTFRTVILQEYTDDFPSGDPSVDQGDVLGNRVSVDGDLLNVWDLAPNGQSEADGSSAGVAIASGTLSKSIYAVNGEICPTQPCEDVIIAPDQLLTYRITYTIPSPDIEDLVFSDYLPLPIFEADEIGTTFNTAVSAAAPPAGQAKFGPADTFFALSSLTPLIETNVDANRVRFTYGDYDNVDTNPYTIDLLFTVTATDVPFADRLFLTNQVRSVQGSTNGDDLIIDDIVFVQVGQPVLTMRKGVVAAYNNAADNGAVADAVFAPSAMLPAGVSVNAPGTCFPTDSRIEGLVQSGNLGTTFDSNLSGVDAFDRVTYAIVVENTGAGIVGAYDVQIKDVLPAGVSPSDVSNLCVQYGDGTERTYTDTTGAAATIDDLFGAGIELVDDVTNSSPPPSILGALGPGLTQTGDVITDGKNLVIVTYDVILPQGIEPGDTLENTGSIVQYAGAEGGEDHIAAGEDFSGTTEDPASTAIDGPADRQVDHRHQPGPYHGRQCRGRRDHHLHRGGRRAGGHVRERRTGRYAGQWSGLRGLPFCPAILRFADDQPSAALPPPATIRRILRS